MFSHSVTEFWRRWHISLSFWFRDYVYIPLGGNRGGQLATARNLLIVFFLTGLWHGASWTFVLWGIFHGAFLLAERLVIGRFLQRLPSVISWAYCIVAVRVGWVLFRASDLSHAAVLIKAMFNFGSNLRTEPIELYVNPEAKAAMPFGIVFSFPVLPAILKAMRMDSFCGSVVPGTAHADVVTVHAIPVAALVAGFSLSTMLLVGSSLNPFLYFRF